MKYEDYIRSIPDFPQQGVIFRDITPLLKDGKVWNVVIDEFAKHYEGKKFDAIAGIESRGFMFGSTLAYKMGLGFIPIRKSGKLPWNTISVEYALEYGTASIEIHKDAFKPDDKVLLIDDVIATGGSLKASCELIEKLGAKVEDIGVLIELTFLKGREALQGYNLFSIIKY